MSDQTFDLLRVLSAMTHIVASRLLSVVSLAMTFGLFCWAMYLQTPMSAGIAGGFAIAVFLPVLAADRRKGEAREPHQA
jgi:uncharacterized membrane protein YraQ (UPF0718 family)